MKVVSLNVGLPRDVPWRGKTVRTAIFKSPVDDRLRLGRLNFRGDRQADLSVHGGAEKAVYAYPCEHYPFWRQELEMADLSWGGFGENLSCEGLVEDQVRIGDRFRVGSAELVVTQPRVPCFKLGLRFGRPDMVKRFQRSGRSGFYFSVARPGEVGAGDPIELLSTDAGSLTVAEIHRAYSGRDVSLLERAGELAALPEGWRQHFRTRLAKLRS